MCGLARLRLEQDRLGVDRTGSDRHQVVAGEAPVAPHPAVRHPPVEGRTEGHPARPVDGDDASSRRARRFGLAMLTKRRWTIAVSRPSESWNRSCRVSTARRRSSSCLYSAQPHLREVEPLAVIDPEGEGEPVREVDDRLVLDLAAGDLARQAVVETRPRRCPGSGPRRRSDSGAAPRLAKSPFPTVHSASRSGSWSGSNPS